MMNTKADCKQRTPQPGVFYDWLSGGSKYLFLLLPMFLMFPCYSFSLGWRSDDLTNYCIQKKAMFLYRTRGTIIFRFLIMYWWGKQEPSCLEILNHHFGIQRIFHYAGDKRYYVPVERIYVLMFMPVLFQDWHVQKISMLANFLSKQWFLPFNAIVAVYTWWNIFCNCWNRKLCVLSCFNATALEAIAANIPEVSQRILSDP